MPKNSSLLPDFLSIRHTAIAGMTLFMFLVSMIAINLVMAQEQLPPEEIGEITQEISDPALDINLTDEKQVFPSKRFGITLTIDSTISSNRAAVSWIYPSDVLLIEGTPTDTLTVLEGQRTTFTKYFAPRKEYKSPTNADKKLRFGVRVNTFIAERNYLSSTQRVFDFNSELEKLPVDADYSRDKLVSAILNWAVLIGILSLIVAGIVIAIRKFREYLNKDDET
jgi:hypothetical protein